MLEEKDKLETKYNDVISQKNKQIEEIIEQLAKIEEAYSKQSKNDKAIIQELEETISTLEQETHQEKV